MHRIKLRQENTTIRRAHGNQSTGYATTQGEKKTESYFRGVVEKNANWIFGQHRGQDLFYYVGDSTRNSAAIIVSRITRAQSALKPITSLYNFIGYSESQEKDVLSAGEKILEETPLIQRETQKLKDPAYVTSALSQLSKTKRKKFGRLYNAFPEQKEV